MVTTNGVEQTFRGAVLMCLGDNLGSNALGGFSCSIINSATSLSLYHI